MSMSMGLVHCMRLECTVCEQYISPPNENLKDQLRGDPMTVVLALIQVGCCPQCGTLVTGQGQTPDDVLARFNEHLEGRIRERLEDA